jgi:cell division protein FtsZ
MTEIAPSTLPSPPPSPDPGEAAVADPIETANTRLGAPGAVLKVLGLGGAGSNAVDRMIQLGLSNVEFIAANTDAQALLRCDASCKIQLGARSTRGLGAGGIPQVGEEAAIESHDEIAEALTGADMVFLTAGMGGGTGTGAIPVAAEISRSLGAVTIAVVTTPFTYEGKRRADSSRMGLEKLRQHVDTLIAVPNDRLLQIVPKGVPFEVALHVADDVLRQGVQGVAELVMRPGLVNVDFAHVRSLMKQSGGAFLAIGTGTGPSKAVEAAHEALHHPLLDNDTLDQAAGMLAHFTGGDDLGLLEISQAVNLITQAASPDADIIFGATVDPSFNGRVQVILIATGVGSKPLQEAGELWSAVTANGKGQAPAAEAEAEAEPEEALAGAEARPAVRPPSRDEVDEPAFLRRRRMLLHQRR